MRKNELNEVFRNHVRSQLSPTVKEKDFVSIIYKSVQAVLGESHCIQIGSYPRFTSVTPMHDLDVLYIIGEWERPANPATALNNLQSLLEREYQNPAEYQVEISRQTHSITLTFSKSREDFFAVDIVPAYISGTNEFFEDTYVVPELLAKSHANRKRLYQEVAKGSREMGWIKSDPRGYITVASQVNAQNSDFRKTAKFIKAWRASCKEMNDSFPLKSFHIEQVVTAYFQQNSKLEIFDAVFGFFCDLPAIIGKARIPDRADTSRNIDEYINEFSEDDRNLVLQARDHFLIKLEEFDEDSDVADLIEAGLRHRASETETYLFDQRIPVLTEDTLCIAGNVLPRDGGFRPYILDILGIIDVDRKIQFRTTAGEPEADMFKWKVKNDDASVQPRGEITDHRTLRDPEETKYRGKHYVECYAIRNGVCIARARQCVALGRTS